MSRKVGTFLLPSAYPDAITPRKGGAARRGRHGKPGCYQVGALSIQTGV